MSAALDPTGRPVRVSPSVILRTPGLRGVATIHAGGSAGMRAAELSTPDFDAALTDHGLTTQATIEIANTSEVATSSALSTRGPSVPERAFAVEVAAPSPGYGQMVLKTDEAGVMSWSFAAPGTGNAREYLVRRPVRVVDGAAPAQRGLIGAIGKKVIKILAFKLADEVLGAVGEHFARRWEEKHRPYLLRPFGPGDASIPGSSLEAAGWERLRGNRALLLVHGTFSRAHAAFGALPAPVLTTLQERYPGGVVAFDHFTLSDDPRANVERLVQLLPHGLSIDVDVLTHSRGGLVARVLAERFAEIGGNDRSVRIGRVVFVGTPNGGTVLADAEHIGDLIDTYTNVLNFLPDNGVTEVLDGVITVAKVVAVGTVGGLDGIGSMVRDGPFLGDWLNGAGGERAEYHAIASDYEPADRGLLDFAKDRLTDALFGEGNDLVVPTGGVAGANGANGFPIADPLLLGASAAVGHTRYFADRRVQDKLLHWLSG